MTSKRKAAERRVEYRPKGCEAQERTGAVSSHRLGVAVGDAKGAEPPKITVREAYDFMVALYGDVLKELEKY